MSVACLLLLLHHNNSVVLYLFDCLSPLQSADEVAKRLEETHIGGGGTFCLGERTLTCLFRCYVLSFKGCIA